EAPHAARKDTQNAEDRQGTAFTRNTDRRRGGRSSRRPNRGQERYLADRRHYPIKSARDHDAGIGVTNATRGAHRAHALWSRHEQRPHAGGSRPTVFGDARANSTDRGQGNPKAQAPKPIKGP